MFDRIHFRLFDSNALPEPSKYLPRLLEMGNYLDEFYYSHPPSSPPCIPTLLRALGHIWSIEKETRSYGDTKWPSSNVTLANKEPLVPNQ
jgi:hypothetical protein